MPMLAKNLRDVSVRLITSDTKALSQQSSARERHETDDFKRIQISLLSGLAQREIITDCIKGLIWTRLPESPVYIIFKYLLDVTKLRKIIEN